MASPNHDAVVLKPIQHSKRTDQIVRLLHRHRYNFTSGKALINLALKIERLLVHTFPHDAPIVLSSDELAVKVSRIITKVLQLRRNRQQRRRSFTIASMLNPVDGTTTGTIE
ncbi:hypothetical protein H257_08972 [Aphanomyces astaci]|uniref:Uncharacterized protein n=1 Tax=Aphanomyces astaci TaxID=112090 RepID=W4GDE0_APHAT|nr:hypothetical protein H257_08972 [Aphanomyces astaci]ETV77064.1 hypothetical protein H257_08972 [Aphanomyces astaci]|eukprot:XP_009833370.1 hypothetical protein H257_08972 [Aphanomyces astaci]